LWGLTLVVIILATTVMALRNYRKLKAISWLIISIILVLISFIILLEALGIKLLGNVDLTSLLVLGAAGPQQGLLAVAHLLSDFSVVGLGIFLFYRWYKLRTKSCAVGAAAAFTGCCGTTAILLAGFLGIFGIHSEISFIIVAILVTAALAALAWAWSGRLKKGSK